MVIKYPPALKRGWLKQIMIKKLVVLYAKRKLTFLQWEFALYSHASGKKHKEHLCEPDKYGVIDLFLNKPCSSGKEKNETPKAKKIKL